MDLKRISNIELTSRLEKLVRSERKITHIILIHILEIESRRLYAELGFDGMFSYLTKGLGYSESAAYRRLQSARLLKAIPTVSEKLELGSLNLSQLSQVQKFLKVEGVSGLNSSKIQREAVEIVLAKIENKNSFETKSILALEFEVPIQAQTVISPQKDESVRIEITFSKKQFEALQDAKNILSHTIHNNSLAEVIEHLALKFNKSVLREDKENETPLPKMTRGFTAKKVKRPYLSIKLKRRLMNQAAHECQYVNESNGRKCGSKYQLQVDHIHPFAKGGSNDLENLQILCRTHNYFKGINVK